MNATVDRYFHLVDAAVQGQAQIDALTALFADEGVLTAADGSAASGRTAIRAYLEYFYTHVTEQNRHYYVITSENDGRVEADWAVAGKLRQGGVIALQGHNVFQLAWDGRIKSLQVFNA